MLRRALALLVLGWILAAAASAATTARSAVSTTFAVSVEGSQRTIVTSALRSIDDVGCAVLRSDVERQTLAFSTRRPGRLVAVRGRAASTVVAVAVQATGTKRRIRTISGTAPECDVAPETSETSCGPTAYAGLATVTLPTFGFVRLTGAAARRRDRAVCAPTNGPGRGFLALSEGRFSPGLLTVPSAARVILRGDVRLTDNLPSGARRVTILRWTITLRRL